MRNQIYTAEKQDFSQIRTEITLSTLKDMKFDLVVKAVGLIYEERVLFIAPHDHTLC